MKLTRKKESGEVINIEANSVGDGSSLTPQFLKKELAAPPKST